MMLGNIIPSFQLMLHLLAVTGGFRCTHHHTHIVMYIRRFNKVCRNDNTISAVVTGSHINIHIFKPSKPSV